MDKKGFVPNVYDSSVRFMEISVKMFEFYRKLLGTEVKVTRITGDKRKQILSATLTSTFSDNKDIMEFNWKILINQSQMNPRFRSNTGTFDIYDVIDKLEIGDLLKFNYLGMNYEFKVTAGHAYGNGAKIIYQYTLSAINEYTT